MPKIVTNHVYPPIPIRQFDWVAHYDDEEGPTGWGTTEEEAIKDLVDNHDMTGCDCGAPIDGKWAYIHSKNCSVFKAQ